MIKKTVMLTDSDAEGYVSVIRVGYDVGAKIVGTNFRSGMRAGLKIGGSKPVFVTLTGERTEITLEEVSFQQNDAIGCVIADGDKLIARGGSGVRLKDVTEYFASHKEEPEEELVKQELLPAEEETTNISSLATEETSKALDAQAENDKSDEENSPAESSEEKELFLSKLSETSDGDFYAGIRDKLDELFVIHPAQKQLDAIIPNSEWIKINYDGDDYYVVGKLKQNNRTVLIGYGVPGKKNATPPKIADEIASYLSVDGVAPYDGYWLIFQDANTGKIVKAE